MTWSRSAIAGLALGVIALLCLLAAGLGTRFGWWDYRTGFTLLRAAAWIGIATVVIGLLGCFRASRPRRRGLALAAAALVAGVLAFAVPYAARQDARRYPPIHDITTDAANPPRFGAILPLRAGARNPATYDGPGVAALQKKAYPDIVPLFSPASAGAIYKVALETARALGWTIIATDQTAGRIEATDRTFWFGFTDDIVIRIARADRGTRLDIRSKSRVGRGDAGANARRISRFLVAIRLRMER